MWCGVAIGLAFMTKMLQGWMVVPALAGTYVLAGPPRFLRRMWQLLLAGVAMVAVSAAWPVAVSLWPADSRPYIGGSTNGSVWDLIFGYNGFGRLTGAEGGGPGGGFGGGGGGPTFGGASGLWRMFNEQVGGQVAWLLPIAGVSLLAGLWLTRRAPRTDLRRAGLVLFGVWAIVHVAVFSSQQGIFHAYYVSALAPAVAALSSYGVVALARWTRASWAGFVAFALAIGTSAWVAVMVLARTPDFAPALRTILPVAAALAVVAALAARLGVRGRAALAVGAVCATVALAAGPAAYSVATVRHSLTSNNVLAGPASAGAGFGGGRGGSGGPQSGFGGPGGAPRSGARLPSATPPSGATSSGAGFGGGRSGGSVSDSLVAYLEAHQGSAKYLVAANGSMTTAPIIIKTGKAVVTIGGFNGSDPAPTLSQLQGMVAKGELRYVLIGGGGPGGRGGSDAIATWVQRHGTAVTSVSTSGGTLYRVRGGGPPRASRPPPSRGCATASSSSPPGDRRRQPGRAPAHGLGRARRRPGAGVGRDRGRSGRGGRGRAARRRRAPPSRTRRSPPPSGCEGRCAPGEDRPYKPALPRDAALAEVDRLSGTQFMADAAPLLGDALSWWAAAA